MAFEMTLARLKSLKARKNAPKALKMVLEEAKRRCPVDTGQLRASGRIKHSQTEYGIMFEAPYALFVHEILSNYHPVGEAKFLENAWNVKKGKFIQMLLDD